MHRVFQAFIDGLGTSTDEPIYETSSPRPGGTRPKRPVGRGRPSSSSSTTTAMCATGCARCLRMLGGPPKLILPARPFSKRTSGGRGLSRDRCPPARNERARLTRAAPCCEPSTTGYHDRRLQRRADGGSIHEGRRFRFHREPVGNVELLASIERALEQSRDGKKLSARREDAANHIATLTSRQRQIMELVLAGPPARISPRISASASAPSKLTAAPS
jgi:hypothetical protein